jgi:hypothetical protein
VAPVFQEPARNGALLVSLPGFPRRLLRFPLPTVIRVTCPAATAVLMARMTGAVGRIGAFYFAIIVFVAVMLVIWADFGQ